ncbi:hypothetical protein J6590_026560 [Homalodisca vitripennis]|nr:hypothetical protein J6590_026560 [Homalodisca vitripennis]
MRSSVWFESRSTLTSKERGLEVNIPGDEKSREEGGLAPEDTKESLPEYVTHIAKWQQHRTYVLTYTRCVGDTENVLEVE